MKTLNDSTIFKELINGNKIRNTIKNVNILRDQIDNSRLTEQLMTIDKKYNFPLKHEVLNNLNTGKIKIIRNDDNAFPRYLNTVVKKENGVGNSLISIVDITNFSTISRDNNSVSIQPKQLYALLQNATITLSLVNNWDRFVYNTSLVQWSSISYSKIVCKILDKMMGINISEERSDLVHYLVAKFFLRGVLGLPDAVSLDSIAIMSTYNGNTYEYLKEMEMNMLTSYEGNPYDNIITFFKFLSNLETMKRLSFRTFMEQYLRMYGESTMLSLDYFPAFISMIFSTSVSSGLSKEYMIDFVGGKSNIKIISEFSKLI